MNGFNPAGLIDRVFEKTVVPLVLKGGQLAWGICAAANVALADRQAYPLTLDPVTGGLRVAVAGASGTGIVAFHINTTITPLAAGSSTRTFRTVTAAKVGTIKSCLVGYISTNAVPPGAAGVSAQLVVGGVPVDEPALVPLATTGLVRLLSPGQEIDANATETFQVFVQNAAAGDSIVVLAQVIERPA